MKTIRIYFVDFFSGFDMYHNTFIDVLSKRYDVVISENPDYLFYSVFGMNHLKYQCIRIFYTGECYTPNFNECDYAIGFDRLSFGDRYIRVPLYQLFQYKDSYESIKNRKPLLKQDLKKKDRFCNFVYSNCFAQDKRTQFFRLLSSYKKVDSGGRYLNNIGGPVKDKKEFQKHYKYSIAFENTSYDGYSTEKIMEAFAARTIPIYYGDPRITEDFNDSSFINCHQYNSFEEVVEVIDRIEHDDELFLKIINENPIKLVDANLEGFLYQIFEQSLSEAKRRPRSNQAISDERMRLRHLFFEKYIYQFYRKVINRLQKFMKNTFHL